MEARNDNTWSADTHDIDASSAGPLPGSVGRHTRSDSNGTEHGGNQQEDEYQLLHGNQTAEFGPPASDYGRRPPERRYDDEDELDQHNRYSVAPPYEDTEYRGGRMGYHPSSSLTPDAYEREQSGPAFPPAPYGYGGPQTPRDVV